MLNFAGVSFNHRLKIATFNPLSLAASFSEKGLKRDVTAASAATDTASGDYKRIILSDVLVKKKEKEVVWWAREWRPMDFGSFDVVLSMHLLCLLAPFQFNFIVVSVAFVLYIVTGLLGITLSFHRNLTHKSFKLPKWLRVLVCLLWSSSPSSEF
ncbi:unnamed protein product [Cochlearia groenlandica]